MSLDFKWYVVRAISGQEQKVKSYIEAELAREGLSAYVPQILIPMEKVYQVKNNKKITKDKNYFPGYILVEADLTGEVAPTIKAVNGVVGFLGSKDKPIPLRENEVKRILGTLDEVSDKPESLVEPFLVGEQVKVTDGPFNGFTGKIEDVMEDKKKLKVTVKIFGRNTLLELNYLQVEKE